MMFSWSKKLFYVLNDVFNLFIWAIIQKFHAELLRIHAAIVCVFNPERAWSPLQILHYWLQIFCTWYKRRFWANVHDTIFWKMEHAQITSVNCLLEKIKVFMIVKTHLHIIVLFTLLIFFFFSPFFVRICERTLTLDLLNSECAHSPPVFIMHCLKV